MTSLRLALRAAPLAALALAACAHAGTAAAPAAGVEPPPTVAVTGSRLPQRADPATGRAVTDTPVKVYPADELRRSGQRDLGQALRAADSDVH